MFKRRNKHSYDLSGHQFVVSPEAPQMNLPAKSGGLRKLVIAGCAVIIAAVIVIITVLIYKHFEAHHVEPGNQPHGQRITQPPQDNPSGIKPHSTTSNGATSN